MLPILDLYQDLYNLLFKFLCSVEIGLILNVINPINMIVTPGNLPALISKI